MQPRMARVTGWSSVKPLTRQSRWRRILLPTPTQEDVIISKTDTSGDLLNPLARDETQIFRALLDAQHMIGGFSIPTFRNKPKDSPPLKDMTASIQ
jgi:hypothetical protein